MTNLKKALAFLIVFTMVLSTITVAFASPYADVKDDANYAEAVTTLSSLNLLKGDDKGNFNPDQTITRAEFAAVVDRILGLGDPGKTTTQFTDVAADHWASGYISQAANMGVIKGVTTTTFEPDSPVTFEQAIKMIVAALGYTPEAEQRGGYPTGYLLIAAREGITDGVAAKVGESAKRSDVAKLAYNALDVPLMEQTGFGTDITYTKQDGTGDTSLKTLLSEKLDIDKVQGVVTKNYSVEDVDVKDADKKVQLRLDKINDKKVEDYEDEDFTTGETIDVKVASTNAKELLGYTVIAYVKDLDDSTDATLFSIAPKAGQNQLITITDLDNIVVDSDDDVLTDYDSDDKTYTFQYWIDKDNDDDPEDVDVSSSAALVKNGVVTGDKVASGSNPLDKGDLVPNSGKVVLLDNNDDDIYDYYFFTDSYDVIVDEVTSSGSVTGKGTYSIDFDDDDDNLSYTIYLDGKEIKPSDLKEWDVITVIDTEDYSTDSNRAVTAYVTRQTAEGIAQEDASEDNTEKYALDDNKTYTFKSDWEGGTGVNDIKLGNEYTFYLNTDGKVVWVEKGSTVGASSDNYAYLFDVGKQSGLDKGFEVQLLNAKGEWVTYDTDDKFSVNDGVLNNGEKYKGEDTTEIPNLFEFIGDNFDRENCGQVVTYKLTSDNKLSEINSSIIAKLKNQKDEFVSKDDETATAEYKNSSSKLGKYFIDDSTVIFSIDSKKKDDKDSYKVIKPSTFKDDDDYQVEFYDLDNSQPEAIVAYDVAASIDDESGFFVVKSVSSARNADDEDVYKLTGYQNGEDQSVIVADDCDVYHLVRKADSVDSSVYYYTDVDYSYNVANLKGAVIQYSKNSDDEVSKIRILYTKNMYNEDFVGYVGEPDGDLRVFCGTVQEKGTGNKVTIWNNDDQDDQDTDSIKISGANYARVDYSNGIRITTSGIDAGDVTAPTTGSKAKPGTKVIIREYEGTAKDVIIIEGE